MKATTACDMYDYIKMKHIDKFSYMYALNIFTSKCYGLMFTSFKVLCAITEVGQKDR